jgi:hypothetical protein
LFLRTSVDIASVAAGYLLPKQAGIVYGKRRLEYATRPPQLEFQTSFRFSSCRNVMGKTFLHIEITCQNAAKISSDATLFHQNFVFK